MDYVSDGIGQAEEDAEDEDVLDLETIELINLEHRRAASLLQVPSPLHPSPLAHLRHTMCRSPAREPLCTHTAYERAQLPLRVRVACSCRRPLCADAARMQLAGPWLKRNTTVREESCFQT